MKLQLKNLKPYFSLFLPFVENQTNTIPTLIPLFTEYYEELIQFYQKPKNTIKLKGIRVGFKGIMFSTKGNKTKIRAFNITFKSFGFTMMTFC